MRSVAFRLELGIKGICPRREIFQRAEVEQLQRPQNVETADHDMRADRGTDFGDAGRLIDGAIEARDARGVEATALPDARR